jgi:hypothetical protein
VSAAELVAAVAVLFALVTGVSAGVAHLSGVLAIRSAAGQVSAAFLRARMEAITRGAYVGLKFRIRGDRYEWALYGDGNGNGIRSFDIANGTDRPIGIAASWSRNDVRPAIMEGIAVPDPDGSGRPLDRTGDPIRFNASDIGSFSPTGECTPGSVYLWDGKDRMAVVRVLGRTGKIRTLYYRRGDFQWKK